MKSTTVSWSFNPFRALYTPRSRVSQSPDAHSPRDALLTILHGLLTNPDQLDGVRAGGKWRAALRGRGALST